MHNHFPLGDDLTPVTSAPMRRLKTSNLKNGDIILTTTNNFPSGIIRKMTKADISHAMLYVSHSSVIHAVTNGVHSANTQRIFFEPNLAVHVLRHEGLDTVTANQICDHARSVVGTEYSIPEAMWSVTQSGRNFSPKQFCSRLVAQAYAKHGKGLVSNPNFCNPGQLLRSPKLTKIADTLEDVSEEEYLKWQEHPTELNSMADTTVTILNGARKLNSKIQSLQDLIAHLVLHPEHDEEIDTLFRTSGYLDVYKPNLDRNQWQFNLIYMEDLGLHEQASIRDYCVGTLSEGRSEHRFVKTLETYKLYQLQHPRKTYQTLINLYTILVQLHMQRLDVAEAWLAQHGH